MSDWIVRGIGFFYLAGGLVVLVALTRGRFMDAALEALTGGTQAKHRIRFILLAAGGALTAVSGLAALLLSRWAIALMLANVAAQALWLGYARLRFPPEDEDDALGRRRTINAAVGFLAATVLVVWLHRSGYVRLDGPPWGEAALAALAFGLAGWATVVWRRGGLGVGAVSGAEDATPQACFTPPRQVRLEPAFGCWPLWDHETDRNLDPSSLDLPEALAERIRAFEDATLEATDPDHEDGPTLRAEARAPLASEAAAICRLLIEIYGEDNVCWRLPGDV